MGSLKEEMRGFGEDHKPCEKADDGDHPGGSDGSAVPGGPQLSTSQESTSQGDYKPGLHTNGNYPISKELSRGVCDDAEQSDSAGVEDSAQTVSIPLIQQPEADKTAAATHDDKTISNKFLSDADGEIQGGTSRDKSMDHDKEKEAENENISVPVPPTPGPSDPCSPAPVGQHHMHTQVSLEVVQCHSAATSPMTPPQCGHSFFFPSAIGRSVGSNTNDAELQVGRLVELCSVATSPMTPKTPSTTAFPELIGRETVQREERGEKREEQKTGGQQESFPARESPAEAESEITGELTCTTSKELREDLSSNAPPESSVRCPAAAFIDTQVTLEDSNQHCKQQRMASMDQDITITVTQYNNNDEEEEGELSFYHTEPDMVKIDEYEHESISHVKGEDGEENISTETVAPAHAQETSNANPPQNQTEEVCACGEAQTDVRCEHSEVKGELRDGSVMKPPVPESPAPFGCHNIRTQVSLEVVQCQSVATSPMTPPEGEHAFYFPSSFGRVAAVGAETTDAELPVGQQVEFRSVATAPMTPRTPTTTSFPEIRKGTSIEEKIEEEEEEEGKQEQVDKEEVKEEEKVPEETKVTAAEEDTEGRNCKEKGEEPVQEVSWDEKGMTWEVYGAVVEVTVLGSAIQKHLEKQVKKRQPSMPPPPPLNPSAMPLSSESIQGQTGKRGEGDGEVSRRRRNPFRLMMENMQQPHCCSKAHTTE